MSGEKLNSIDAYERFINATIEAWLPEQRIALAAGMAERWLPVYEAFSTREGWGDPAHMRHSLDAVWNHLQGKTLSPDDVKRYLVQVEDSMPHMDFTDDRGAISASFMVSEALRCCRTDKNKELTMQAVISGFEAIAPDWDMEIEEESRLWRQIKVQREFKKQLKLVEEIEATTQLDSATIQALRKKLMSKEYIGEAMPVAEPTTAPPTITNQTAFEIYRGLVESGLKHHARDWWEDDNNKPGSFSWGIYLFAEWSGRYKRRGDTINPGFGSSKLADVTAQQALMAWHRARDSAIIGVPDWGPELQQLVEMGFQNANDLGVNRYDKPHSYGLSMRALWLEAERRGHPKEEIWRHIVAWARHLPTAWALEDQRNKKGLAHTTPELGALLAHELNWDTTNDLEYPWATDLEGERWQIRLNDFPDAFMYSLLIDGRCVGDFHDWPETWGRE
jgi:uncharacterized protein YjaG (DUF416 family)